MVLVVTLHTHAKSRLELKGVSDDVNILDPAVMQTLHQYWVGQLQLPPSAVTITLHPRPDARATVGEFMSSGGLYCCEVSPPLAARLAAAQAELREEEARSAALRVQVRDLGEANVVHKQEKKVLKHALRSARQGGVEESADMVQALEARLQASAAERLGMEQQVDALKARIAPLDDRLAQLQAELTAARARATAAERQSEAASRRLAVLETREQWRRVARVVRDRILQRVASSRRQPVAVAQLETETDEMVKANWAVFRNEWGWTGETTAALARLLDAGTLDGDERPDALSEKETARLRASLAAAARAEEEDAVEKVALSILLDVADFRPAASLPLASRAKGNAWAKPR